MSRLPAPLPALAAASIVLALLTSTTLVAETPTPPTTPPASEDAKPKPVLGAAAILELASTPLDPDDQPGHAGNVTQAQQAFLADIRQLDRLTPGEAGQRWATHLATLIEQPESISPQGLFAFMPGPESWPAIAEHLQATPEPKRPLARFRRHLFLALSHSLLNEADAADQQLADARQVITRRGSRFAMQGHSPLLESLNELTGQATEPNDANAYEQLLARIRSIESQGYIDDIRLNDLIPRFGEERARTLLTEAFKKDVIVEPTGDLPSRRLAQRIAVEMAKAGTLKVPQLALVDGFNTIAVYEALTGESADAQQPPAHNRQPGLFSTLGQAFGLSGPDLSDHTPFESWTLRSARRQAQTHYLTALVAANRLDDAERFLASLPTPDPDDDATPLEAGLLFERAKATDTVAELLDTFDATLQARVDRSLLRTYAQLALLTGQADRAVELFKTPAFTEQLNTLSAATKADALIEQASLWLALGEHDHAVALLRRVIEQTPTTEPAGQHRVAATARTLAQIGRALDDPDLLHDSARLAAQHHDFNEDQWQTQDVAELLADAGLPAQAEAFLGRALRIAVQQSANPNSNYYHGSNTPAATLASLTALYAQQGRHHDVLTLLQQAPWWGAADLADLDFWGDTDPADLQLFVIQALAETGQADRTKQLLTAAMPDHLGNDTAYALLVELMGPDALPVLDQLIAMDRFEERPLIWKATVLLQQGDADTALRLAEKAIAIDPSDGEQGHGDRMRAYAVLADAHAARDQPDKAAFFQDVVAAIRQSEQADRLYAAGLVAPALDLYAISLDRFSDAYCIQARIALRLASQGRLEEAKHHYRRSYELMPGSFGRIESHCFGCEGAFSGDTAQSIAQEVFEDMLEDDQTNPQLHYLVGYLRESQDQPHDALAAYRQAVTLDPDYFNAWKKLASLDNTPAELRSQAGLRMLELDPLQRHHSARQLTVTDYAQLWGILAHARTLQPDTTAAGFPLPAAAAHLKNDPNAQHHYDRHPTNETFFSFPDRNANANAAQRILRQTYQIDAPPTIGFELARTRLFSHTARLIEFSQYFEH
ncbi:MAG: hypothetical protein AAF797_14415 [Planctomycetota bacterium]